MVRKARAILFEDDPDIRKMVEMLLKSNGCEVFTYADPSLCLLQQTHECQCSKEETCADLLITDIDMPFVSGLDFIDDQTRKGCKVKNIAILSGAWSDESMKRAQELGCAIFHKPSFFYELSEWIDSCLEGRNQRLKLSDWFLDSSLEQASSGRGKL